MKYSIYIITAFLLLLSGCKDNSSNTESITCFNDGIAVGGECECMEGYTGPRCGEQETPETITVNSITITRFPSTAEGGAGWDAASGPDIYPFITTNNEVVWDSNTYFENASNDNNNTIETDIRLTEPTQDYTIDLYDYDQNTDDDFMGGVFKAPYSSGNGFPETIEYDADGDVAFELDVSYSW